jgi:hypothetical protein
MRKGLDKTFLDNNLLRSPEFMAHTPSVKGWWLQLQALCSSQENSGRLVGAAKWSNKAWQSAMGNGGSQAAFKKLLDLGLVKQAGDDVIVSGYHLESQAKFQAARLNGAKGGQASAASRAGATLPRETDSPESESTNSLDNPASDAQATLKRCSSAQGEEGDGPDRNAKGSGGRDRSGPDRSGSEAASQAGAPPAPKAPETVLPKAPAAPGATGLHQPCTWDSSEALADACGKLYRNRHRGQSYRWPPGERELLSKALEGLSGDERSRFAANLRSHFDNVGSPSVATVCREFGIEVST